MNTERQFTEKKDFVFIQIFFNNYRKNAWRWTLLYIVIPNKKPIGYETFLDSSRA